MKKSEIREMIKEEMLKEGSEYKTLMKDLYTVYKQSLPKISNMMEKEYQKLYKKYPNIEKDEFIEAIYGVLDKNNIDETMLWATWFPK